MLFLNNFILMLRFGFFGQLNWLVWKRKNMFQNMSSYHY